MEINLKNRTGTMELNSRHSLIMGNKPTVITPEMVVGKFEKDNHEFEKFGLFDSSTPNYTTYYPDVTPEDLKPKDEDFIYPVFRALSATVVWKGYKPIDFSQGEVLKKAMNLLIGQTINADHETALGNAMGTVKGVFWQDAYTKEGVKVPAGINAEFKIDGKSNPRIARAIQMDPPAIHSNSVSVRFTWKPSHTLKSDEDFFQKLGTKDDKGELYRLVVTEIVHFSETSLVSHGADAFAQIIGSDGKIVNPVYASGVYNFSINEKGEKKEQKYSHVLDYKDTMSLSFDKDTTIPEELINNHNKEKTEEMKYLEILEEKFGLEKGTLTDENFSTKISEILTSKETESTKTVGDLEAKVSGLETEKTNLEAKVVELNALKPKADKFDEKLTAAKVLAKKNYRLAKGDKADETILNLIDKQGLEEVEALTSQYALEVETKFPTTCKDCGSTHLSKASTFNEEQEEEGNESFKPISNSEARAKLLKKKKS